MLLEKANNLIFAGLLMSLLLNTANFSYFILCIPLGFNIGVRYGIYKFSSLVNSCISFTDLVILFTRISPTII